MGRDENGDWSDLVILQRNHLQITPQKTPPAHPKKPPFKPLFHPETGLHVSITCPCLPPAFLHGPTPLCLLPALLPSISSLPRNLAPLIYPATGLHVTLATNIDTHATSFIPVCVCTAGGAAETTLFLHMGCLLHASKKLINFPQVLLSFPDKHCI